LKTRVKRVSFDERIPNGIGVLTVIVDSGSFAVRANGSTPAS